MYAKLPKQTNKKTTITVLASMDRCYCCLLQITSKSVIIETHQIKNQSCPWKCLLLRIKTQEKKEHFIFHYFYGMCTHFVFLLSISFAAPLKWCLHHHIYFPAFLFSFDHICIVAHCHNYCCFKNWFSFSFPCNVFAMIIILFPRCWDTFF